MGILAVKRRLAPIALARRRGNIEAAISSAGSAGSGDALAKLSSGFYAKTSEGPRRAVLSAVRRILSAAGFDCLPLTMASLAALAAALKESGYRSAKTYLLRAKQEHVRSGFEWSAQLEDLLQRCLRSVARGLGCGHVASAFTLDAVVDAKTRAADTMQPVVKGGMVAPPSMRS